MNLFDVFQATAARQPEHVAFTDLRHADSCSYRELHARIGDAAESLRAAGVDRGACIGLHCPSGIAYVVWAYAIWQRDATIVPLPPEMSADEKAAICREIHLDGIVTGNAERSAFGDVSIAASAIELNGGAILLRPLDPRPHPAGFYDVNAAFIRFTSGTTATCKGVVLSHETVFDRIHAANAGLTVGPSDTILWLLSMSYHFTVSIVAYLSFGAHIVQCADFFGDSMVSAAVDMGVTVIYGSPAHFAFMNHDRSGAQLPRLRLAISTAGPLKPEIADIFENRFGAPISQAYGIIEVGLPCINLEGSAAKIGSVGRPLPGYDLRLRDVGLGAELQAIDVRGKGIVDAYYHPWRSRGEIMTDGWFSTGDLGHLDQDGYLFIRGRSNAVINVSGMKLFPEEVEAVLESHPAVAAALVYGEPHASLGEVPCADVILVSTAGGETDPSAALRAHCLAHLAPYKVPRSFRFVSELPRTASGKLVRHRPGRSSV